MSSSFFRIFYVIGSEAFGLRAGKQVRRGRQNWQQEEQHGPVQTERKGVRATPVDYTDGCVDGAVHLLFSGRTFPAV